MRKIEMNHLGGTKTGSHLGNSSQKESISVAKSNSQPSASPRQKFPFAHNFSKVQGLSHISCASRSIPEPSSKLRPLLPAPPTQEPGVSPELDIPKPKRRKRNEVLNEMALGPSNLPPDRYRTYESPLKPKKPRHFAGAIEPETFEYLTDRIKRLETAVDHYVDQRKSQALQRSLVPGLEAECEESDEE